MLHGRDLELARIQALFDAARDGSSGALTIVGDPGSGKTALIDEALSRVSANTQVLRANGVETESDLPFAGLDQLLRRKHTWLDRLPNRQAEAMRTALGLADGVVDIQTVSMGVLNLIAESSEESPIVVVVDDVQWLDHESTKALAFAARRITAERVAMLFATRPGLRLLAVPQLQLGGLDRPSAARVIADASGADPAPEVMRVAFDQTEGNPLGLSELARALPQRVISGVDPLPSRLPVSRRVEEAFTRRISALPGSVRALLLLVAADDTGSPAIIISATPYGVDPYEALDRAEAEGLIQADTSEIAFRHPLIRAAVYQGATFAERRAAHLALAESLNHHGDADRAAWHRGTAALAPDEQAASELDQAGTRAFERGAHSVAMAAFEKAAELSASPSARGSRLVTAGAAAWLAGFVSQASQLIRRAEPLVEEPERVAECYRLQGSIDLALGKSTDSGAALIAAAQVVAELDPSRAVELLAMAGEIESGGLNSAAAKEVLDLVGQMDVGETPRDRFYLDLSAGFAEIQAGRAANASQHLRAAMLKIGDESEDVDLLLSAGRAAFHVGDDAAAVDFHERIRSRARKISSVGCLALSGNRLALAELLTGRWAQAVATADEVAAAAADAGQIEMAAQALAWRALADAWRGDEESTIAHVEQSRGQLDARSMDYLEDALGWVQGALALTLGNPTTAALHFRHVSHPLVMSAAALDGFEAAHQSGDTEEISRWMGRLVDTAEVTNAAWAKARLAHARALSAEPAEAHRYFEEALEEHRHGARPFERARTELAYGSMLRRARRRVDARSLLRSAAHTFEELEATPWMDRANTELRATGEAARKRDSSTRFDLTPQEREVAALVVQGLSNRDAADRLFLSPRTVEYHLRNIYTKLGVTSRLELASLGSDKLMEREHARSS